MNLRGYTYSIKLSSHWNVQQSCSCTHQEGICRSRYIAPLVLNLDSIWRYVFSIMRQQLCPGERSHDIHRIGGWVGPKACLNAQKVSHYSLHQCFSIFFSCDPYYHKESKTRIDVKQKTLMSLISVLWLIWLLYLEVVLMVL